MPVLNVERSELAVAESPTVFVAGADDPTAAALVATAGVPGPSGPESFAIVPSANDELRHPPLRHRRARARLRGARARRSRRACRDPWQALREDPLVARPANEVRSVTRLFCSEVADKAWFHDEAFWDRYLSMLIGQRFNRFSLTFGLGYNYHRAITDAYLYFAYPFLLSVAGLRRPRAAAPRRGAGAEPPDAPVHLGASGRSRPRFPAWSVDPRVRVDRQPGRASHDRGAHRRSPCGLLPRCGRRAATGVPGDRRTDLPHPRRERRARGQLGLLANGVLGGRRVGSDGRDRPPRQGSGRGHVASRSGDGHAGDRLSQVLGRAHGTALPPGCHPRARAPRTRRPERVQRVASAHVRERGQSPLHSVRLRRLPARGPRVRRGLPALGRHPAPPALG